jgi:hypothetical protein
MFYFFKPRFLGTRQSELAFQATSIHAKVLAPEQVGRGPNPKF